MNNADFQSFVDGSSDATSNSTQKKKGEAKRERFKRLFVEKRVADNARNQATEEEEEDLPPTEEKMTYVDRAAARRANEKDHDDLLDVERGQDSTVIVGADDFLLEPAHSIKGLDFELLEKRRQDIAKSEANKSVDQVLAQNGVPSLRGRSPLAREIRRKFFNVIHPHETDFLTKIAVLQKSILCRLGKPSTGGVNTFVPGRTVYSFNVSATPIEAVDELPRVLTRSKDDCSSLLDVANVSFVLKSVLLKELFAIQAWHTENCEADRGRRRPVANKKFSLKKRHVTKKETTVVEKNDNTAGLKTTVIVQENCEEENIFEGVGQYSQEEIILQAERDKSDRLLNQPLLKDALFSSLVEKSENNDRSATEKEAKALLDAIRIRVNSSVSNTKNTSGQESRKRPTCDTGIEVDDSDDDAEVEEETKKEKNPQLGGTPTSHSSTSNKKKKKKNKSENSQWKAIEAMLGDKGSHRGLDSFSVDKYKKAK